jgi:hypothetical protein
MSYLGILRKIIDKIIIINLRVTIFSKSRIEDIIKKIIKIVKNR